MSSESESVCCKLKCGNRKFSDHDIMVILELHKEFKECPHIIIAEVSGVVRGNVAKIIDGRIKLLNKGIKLDQKIYQNAKERLEKIIKERKGNHNRDYEKQGMKQAINKRIFTVETMKNILKEKNNNKSYQEVAEEKKYKQTNGTDATVNMIQNICTGRYKLFENDFNNKEEYLEYLKVIDKPKNVNSGKRNVKIKLSEASKYAIKNRLLPVSEMIKILKMKGEKTSKDVLEIEFDDFNKEKIKLGKTEQVNRIWRGDVKIYDNEFSEDFTKEEYCKIINSKPLLHHNKS